MDVDSNEDDGDAKNDDRASSANALNANASVPAFAVGRGRVSLEEEERKQDMIARVAWWRLSELHFAGSFELRCLMSSTHVCSDVADLLSHLPADAPEASAPLAQLLQYERRCACTCTRLPLILALFRSGSVCAQYIIKDVFS